MSFGQTSTPADPPRGSGIKVFMVALVIATTTATSALLGAAGTGAVHNAWQYISLGHPPQVEAEQQRQAGLIDALDRKLRGLRDEVGMLAVHEDQVAGNIKTGLSEIGTYVRQLPGSEAQSGAVKAVRDEVGTLKGNLAQTRIAMLDLRSSIEDGVQARRRDLAEVNKRIERVEGILAARDLTGSVPPAPLKRRTYRIVSGWSVTNVQNGGAIVTGERGIFEVRPGSIIPGLGQVASVRQRASGWIVVTDKGIIVQH